MSEDCKEFEKRAKVLEKEEPMKAIELYKQAANCFSINDKPKDHITNLEKAAKLYRMLAKEMVDPVDALETYMKTSEIYVEAGKTSESEKVMQESNQKFLDSIKTIRSEIKNLTDPFEVEQKLAIASEYAIQAKNEPLSRECWSESGDKFRKSAERIEDPREALEVYKHSIRNYKKGGNEEKEYGILSDAADKFNMKGMNINKTQKQLILAIDNFIQAGTLYERAKKDDKATETEIQVQEICDTIGIPIEYITNYLENQGITPISLE
ncbi:MAG: hypothetical protein ACW99A_14155 [Candidatus Kariarchaeaceae archaeon]|jgi:tetratricopeptide (TPR) repeat protein